MKLIAISFLLSLGSAFGQVGVQQNQLVIPRVMAAPVGGVGGIRAVTRRTLMVENVTSAQGFLAAGGVDVGRGGSVQNTVISGGGAIGSGVTTAANIRNRADLPPDVRAAAAKALARTAGNVSATRPQPGAVVGSLSRPVASAKAAPVAVH